MTFDASSEKEDNCFSLSCMVILADVERPNAQDNVRREAPSGSSCS
jgi:hypothetical protein